MQGEERREEDEWGRAAAIGNRGIIRSVLDDLENGRIRISAPAD